MENNVKIIELDLPFEVSPSTSCLKLYLSENGSKEDYIEFLGWFVKEKNNEGIRITFDRCMRGKMSRLIESDISTSINIGEVVNSPWLEKVKKIQREHYGSDENYKDVHHYFFHGHDADVEILAEKIHWEILAK